VFTCGPEPMMHAVAKLAAMHDVDCQVCMEQAMACGMGTCQSCVVKIEEHEQPHAVSETGRPWRFRLACTDGPVFRAEQVLW
jgi:dihydroorotate dehydrogenase electron transfer subunit